MESCYRGPGTTPHSGLCGCRGTDRLTSRWWTSVQHNCWHHRQGYYRLLLWQRAHGRRRQWPLAAWGLLLGWKQVSTWRMIWATQSVDQGAGTTAGVDGNCGRDSSDVVRVVAGAGGSASPTNEVTRLAVSKLACTGPTKQPAVSSIDR